MFTGAPEYLEAYPMLRMRELDRRAIGDDERTIEWLHWPDLRQETFGTLKYSWQAPTRLWISYEFDRLYGDAPSWGDEHLDITYFPTGRGIHVSQFQCPNCTRGVARLFYKSFDWMCQVCHGLSYRSRLMPRRQFVTEQFAYLNRLLQEGRPHGMSVKLFWRLTDRLSNYYQEKGRYGADIDPAFQRFITSTKLIAELEAKGLL